MPGEPLSPACTDVTSSGIEVPKPTSVRPMTSGETSSRPAACTAPRTSKSPPATSSRNPARSAPQVSIMLSSDAGHPAHCGCKWRCLSQASRSGRVLVAKISPPPNFCRRPRQAPVPIPDITLRRERRQVPFEYAQPWCTAEKRGMRHRRSGRWQDAVHSPCRAQGLAARRDHCAATGGLADHSEKNAAHRTTLPGQTWPGRQ